MSDREGVIIDGQVEKWPGSAWDTPTWELQLSKQRAESIDLISEGEIQGIASGTYEYSGIIGEVGYRSATFNYYQFPQNNASLAWLRSVYLNDVPVLNDNGEFNYQDVEAKFTIGTPNGEVISTLSPYEQATRNIGERVFHGTELSKVYRLLNENIAGAVVIIRVASLSKTNSSTGDVRRDELNYTIYYKPVFNDSTSSDWKIGKAEKIIGKVSKSPYLRNSLILFDGKFLRNKNLIGWEIKITKQTQDFTDDTFRGNAMYVDSITEIHSNIHTFPHSAVVKTLFDAEFFSSLPSRAFETEMMRVKIPGNYNPILRTYSGEGFATTNGGWNGTWATGKHYTNNPAWCYYDLLTNKRYGLGKNIDESSVDKWSLYNIAKYCDTIVPDGYGGIEPRFTCNLWITKREEAYKVINDMASVFRGLTYYSNGVVQAIADQEKVPRTLFTNANVQDGNFNYSTTSKRGRHSIAIVRYNDPKNFYRPSVEYVENLDAIRKYGINEVELTAMGTSSRGQAIRLGRWALLTDNLETESIKFTAGLEGATLRPGDVFKVFDSHKKMKRYGGRTLEFKDIGSTGTHVVLDYQTDLEPNIEYKISFLTPSFSYLDHDVTDVTSNEFDSEHRNFLQSFTFSGWQANNSGNLTSLDFEGPMDYSDYVVTGGTPWILEISDSTLNNSNWTGRRYFTDESYDYFRVINVIEQEVNEYEVEGLQYNAQKFIEIESGILFDRNVFNPEDDKIPATPYNFQTRTFLSTDSEIRVDYSFSISSTKNVSEYRLYANSGSFPNESVPSQDYLFARLSPQETVGYHFPNETGFWNYRVYSYNGIDNLYSAGFASGVVPVYGFDEIEGVRISNLRIVDLSGTYTGTALNRFATFIEDNDTNPTFTWQVGFDKMAFVNEADLRFRATVRINPSIGRIPSNEVVFEAWDISGTSWEFPLVNNINSSGGPHREYQIVIEAHDGQGKTSAGNTLDVMNNDNPEVGKWSSLPFGYDLLNVENPRQTGFQFSTFIGSVLTGDPHVTDDTVNESYRTGVSGLYSTIGYLGLNGDVSVEFTSGQFDADLVGGYLYISSGIFPLREAAINTGWGGLDVSKHRFNFDPKDPVIYHPTAATNIINKSYGAIAISLYDSIDEVFINNGVDMSTGIWISNISQINNNPYAGGIVINPSNNDTGNYSGINLTNYTWTEADGPPEGWDPDTLTYYSLIDLDNAIIFSSGTIDGVTTVIYGYPRSGTIPKYFTIADDV